MKFLVLTKLVHPVPMEMAIPLEEAMIAFLKKGKESGRMESAWIAAGTHGGGGIANVNSLEELDALMTEYPYANLSHTEIIPIVDAIDSAQRSLEHIRAQVAAQGRQ